ncbi:MAG: hypothetical protein GC178_02155 [Flavobacteriales bacterium]|nr:hypothetical protein [Flavobacteriales bacterium]
MNLLIRVILIAGLSALTQTYFPWWTAVLVALAVETALGKGDSTAFFSGFYGVAIPWMALSLFIDVKSDSILTMQILELFKLPTFGIVMVIITGFLGGLVAGVASMTGGWIRAAISK